MNLKPLKIQTKVYFSKGKGHSSSCLFLVVQGRCGITYVTILEFGFRQILRLLTVWLNIVFPRETTCIHMRHEKLYIHLTSARYDITLPVFNYIYVMMCICYYLLLSEEK